jgi:hypothetical protein
MAIKLLCGLCPGAVCSGWRREYNEWRPHRSLDNLTHKQYLEERVEEQAGEKGPVSLFFHWLSFGTKVNRERYNFLRATALRRWHGRF